MYTLNGWWFLSSGGSYPPVFMVVSLVLCCGLVLSRFPQPFSPLPRQSYYNQEIALTPTNFVIVPIISVIWPNTN